jgi:hypothetical protein
VVARVRIELTTPRFQTTLTAPTVLSQAPHSPMQRHNLCCIHGQFGKIVGRGKVLASKSYDSPVNKWCRIKVHCVWKKGRYTFKVYGKDSEGDKGIRYPYRTHFVIY